MISLLGAGSDVVAQIIEFFQGIIGSVTLETILYVCAGIMLAVVILVAISLIWSYEDCALRSIRNVNKYLNKNPQITDANLVEYHKKMKKLPRRIRDRWQLFMLEREGSPSRYLTVEYCVKRPLSNSQFVHSSKQVSNATWILAIFSLVFSLACIAVENAVVDNVVSVLAQCAIVPMVVIVIGSLFTMYINARYTKLNNTLYDEFTSFVRNVDKATNVMPDYVEYELLFTPKEISNGIPVLREYLEKKALEEQRLLEKSKQQEAESSPYDFDDLGIDGAQLIERAVGESEKFMLRKIQLQQEITDLEKQLQKSDAAQEDMQREANRKLQAIKENLERLDKAMNETTNRVEINYNRRLAKEEMDKKLLLEKDLENMLEKERVAADALHIEVEKRKEEIAENKSAIETALKSEYNTFSTKVYQELNDKITQDHIQEKHDLEMTIAQLKAKIKELNDSVEKKQGVIDTRNLELDNLKINAENDKEKLKQENEELQKKAFSKKGKKFNNPTPDIVPEVTENIENDKPEDLPQENNNLNSFIDNLNNKLQENTQPQNEPDNQEADNAVIYPTLGEQQQKSTEVEEEKTEIQYPTLAEQKAEVKVEEESTEGQPVLYPTLEEQVKEEKKKATTEGNDVVEKEKPVKETNKKVADEDLDKLQKEIEAENAKLKKQQEELRQQIDKTLQEMESKTNITKAEQKENIKKIKGLISNLKKEAEEAKARGASKTEINKINKSAAELLKVIADYQSDKQETKSKTKKDA